MLCSSENIEATVHEGILPTVEKLKTAPFVRSVAEAAHSPGGPGPIKRRIARDPRIKGG